MAIFSRAQSNPQFPGNLPNPNPEYRTPDIAGSLDAVFNQYLASRQGARADQLSALQQEAMRQQIAQGQRQAASADLQETAQFGAPIASYSPADRTGAQAQSQPGFEGPKNPKLAQFVEGLRAIQEKSKMAATRAQSDIDLKRSQIAENEAQAAALGQAQIYVDPDTGKQIVVPRGAKLIPRPSKGKPASNQDLNSAMELYETAKEGLISGLGGSETGQIVGRLPAITAKQQIAKGSVAAMAPVLKQIFRTAGEGVFTDRDQQLLLDMIPTRTELPEARAAMIANIDAIVKAKIKSGMRQTQAAPETQTEAAPINLTGAKAARLAELRAKRER